MSVTVSTQPLVCFAAFASLQRVLDVTVSVQNNGLLVATNTSCTAQIPGAACLAKVDAHNSNQKVVINYSVLPNATLDATSHVILKACYSPIATKDRAWRKANNILVVRTLDPVFCTPASATESNTVQQLQFVVSYSCTQACTCLCQMICTKDLFCLPAAGQAVLLCYHHSPDPTAYLRLCNMDPIRPYT